MDQKTKEMIVNLLISATEGGSNYWANLVRIDRVSNGVTEYWQEIPVKTNGCLWVSDSENIVEDDPAYGEPVIYPESGTLTKIDRNQLGLAWAIFKTKYRAHYNDVLNGNDDAATGDAFLQCAVFGEVIYG